MAIEVGAQLTPCGAFCSTTDIAFAPNGHLFISDGYRNARILEYTADGKKIREWGKAGTGPGEFRLPHSIQIDENGVIYVADREMAAFSSSIFRGNTSANGRSMARRSVSNSIKPRYGFPVFPAARTVRLDGSSNWIGKTEACWVTWIRREITVWTCCPMARSCPPLPAAAKSRSCITPKSKPQRRFRLLCASAV